MNLSLLNWAMHFTYITVLINSKFTKPWHALAYLFCHSKSKKKWSVKAQENKEITYLVFYAESHQIKRQYWEKSISFYPTPKINCVRRPNPVSINGSENKIDKLGWKYYRTWSPYIWLVVTHEQIASIFREEKHLPGVWKMEMHTDNIKFIILTKKMVCHS